MYARFIKSLSLAFIASAILFFTACGIIVQWPGASPPDAAVPGLIDLGVKPKTDLPYPMSTTITPNAVPTITTSLPFPNDGEIANSASLTQFGTPLVDDLEAFRLLTYGGGMRRKVVGSNATTMSIYPLGAVVVTSGGIWKTFVHTTTSAVNPTTMAGGALAINTRYWVYAYDNAGSLGFTVSTTGPDANFRYMTGNTNYFYVTTFYTDTGGFLPSYSQVDNKFSFYTATAQPILNAGSALVSTAIALGVVVPPQATVVYLQCSLNTSAAGRYADIGTSAVIAERMVDPGVATHTQTSVDVTFGGGLYYQVSDAATQLTVYALGFEM